jgi:fumarate hydratase class II
MQGHLELNAFKPLIGACYIESARLLSDAAASFQKRCVEGMEVDRARVADMVERSLMLVTALTPLIGYDTAAKIAKLAHQKGITLREAALSMGVMSAEQLDAALRPESMLG